jgi:hypothetical protein
MPPALYTLVIFQTGSCFYAWVGLVNDPTYAFHGAEMKDV